MLENRFRPDMQGWQDSGQYVNFERVLRALFPHLMPAASISSPVQTKKRAGKHLTEVMPSNEFETVESTAMAETLTGESDSKSESESGTNEAAISPRKESESETQTAAALVGPIASGVIGKSYPTIGVSGIATHQVDVTENTEIDVNLLWIRVADNIKLK